jgi:wyosine [tRNA(Phe)-imidazoG37] synthetase (radical SAM superfamily)
MLVSGVNDDTRAVEATAEAIAAIGPSMAWISAPTRPPAEGGVAVPLPERLAAARETFSQAGLAVGMLTGDDQREGFSPTGDAEHGLLAILAVHPMAEAAVAEYLDRAHAPWSVVDALVQSGHVETRTYRQTRFYRRGSRGR